MEAIILLIITSLIGYFLKGKEENTNTPPPVKRKVQRSEPGKIKQTMRQKLDEVSKNVLQNLGEKVPESGELRKQASQMVEKIEEPVRKSIFNSSDSGRSERMTVDRSTIMQATTNKTIPKQDKNSNSFKFPQTSNELAQAIIMAEILGPPKSKR